MTCHCQICGLPFYVSQKLAESGPIFCSTTCEEDWMKERANAQPSTNREYERERRRHAQLMDIAAGYRD